MRRLRVWLGKIFTPIHRGLAPLFGAIGSAWNVGVLTLFRQLGNFATFVILSIIRWFAGLNLRLLLQGLPALLIGLGCITVLGYSYFTPTQETETRYREKAQNSARSKDYPEAITCYERLANLEGDKPEVLFEWATVEGAAGQWVRCILLMNQLAPADQQGYAKAHLWQAQRLMYPSAQTQQTLQLAENHLLRALEGGVEDKEGAHGLLGELYFRKGLIAQAETHLLLAVKERPQFRLTLAKVYALQRNIERAKGEARIAANLYSTKAKADMSNQGARLLWAEAIMFLEEFPQAIAILQDGLNATGKKDIYQPAMARVYAYWFDFLGHQGNITGERMAMLELGLRLDPKNLLLLDRLLGITGNSQSRRAPPMLACSAVGLAGTSPLAPFVVANLWITGLNAEAEAGRKSLNRMLVQGVVISHVHFALGMDAWSRGELSSRRAQRYAAEKKTEQAKSEEKIAAGLYKEARLHWERALDMNSDMPTIANNLAWLLYKIGSKADLDTALVLINKAIKDAPGEVHFRDTRGHILAKKAKDETNPKDKEAILKGAVVDLEKALPFSPNSSEIRFALADVYTQLGLHELAAEHLRVANQMSDINNQK